MDEINEANIKTELQELIPRIVSYRPKLVDPANYSLNSKIPFKILSLREVLYIRISELAETAYDLYKKTNEYLHTF